MREKPWASALLGMDVASLAARAIVRKIKAHDDAPDELRLLCDKLDDMLDAGRNWGEAFKHAIRFKFRFASFRCDKTIGDRGMRSFPGSSSTRRASAVCPALVG